MCGIAGLFHYRDHEPADPRRVEAMNALLVHRGPDRGALWHEGPVALGHRRLSILDLSESGNQPMASQCGRFVLVYNGETYNHQDLRPALQSAGVRFRGHSDTETVVEEIAHHGLDSLARLAGIFAFALWDREERALLLVRDPLGVKQVYFHDDGTRLLFASEIKALVGDREVPLRVDAQAVGEYLHFHTPVGERTFFEGIRALEPGCYLKVSSEGLCSGKYRDLDREAQELGTVGDLEEAKALLRTTVDQTVGSQLMSDVPVGCFLSGGIDSTLVARYARDHAAPGSLQGFGCYFDVPGAVNEEPFGQQIAQSLGLPLSIARPNVNDFVGTFARALYHQDEPRIGAAMVSMWHVSALAARSTKVCLGGQAADELFGGYARYAVASPLKIFWREARRRAFDSATPVGASLQKQVGRRGTGQRILGLMDPRFNWRERFFNTVAQLPEESLRLHLPGLPLATDRSVYYGLFSERVNGCPSGDPVDKVMYWDRKVYLPGLFTQDDRMSMAHSLETRVPLADPRVVLLALRIPNRWKLNGFATKWILKQSLTDVIPAWVINRPKAGFDTPFRHWAKDGGRALVEDLLHGPRTRERGLFAHTSGLLNTIDRPGQENLVWKLANLEMWLRLFVDGDRTKLNQTL